MGLDWVLASSAVGVPCFEEHCHRARGTGSTVIIVGIAALNQYKAHRDGHVSRRHLGLPRGTKT